MFKKMKMFVLTIVVVLFMSNSLAINTSAASDETSKENVIVVLGGSLSESQKEQTRKLLKISGEDKVTEIVVTGEDFKRYVNGDPNSNMYSSAKITPLSKGDGIRVIQLTPENITQVTDSMYINALITAGVEDVQVEVASPLQVTGHSALTGIFKAYETGGEELDTARLDVADEELNLATSLADKGGLTDEQVSELLTAIKQAIAEQNPVTREDVEQIIEEQLNKLQIELTDEYKQMLIDLFDKIRNLNIDYGAVKDQLESLAKDLKTKLEDAGIDEGFFQKIANFFKDLFESIANFFKGLFG